MIAVIGVALVIWGAVESPTFNGLDLLGWLTWGAGCFLLIQKRTR